jgi:hypothetical protein
MSDLLERYLACWNETDAATRQNLLAETWSGDARYVDPLADVRGLAEIDATIAAVQGQFPGFVFTPVGTVDAHHNQARFGWGLGLAGEEPVVVGFDVALTDEAGRITQVLGFLDKVPA